MQAVRENMKLGILPRGKRSVHPDEAVTLVEGQN
jgi:hypothetical protein